MNIILVKIKHGDHQAFKSLFESCHYKLYQFCYRFTNDRDTAEDIVQNIFIHIWNNRAKLNEQTPVEAILFKTAKQEISNWYRSLKNQEERIEDDAMIAEEEDTEDPHLAELQKDYLYKLLDKLPDRRREIFMLHRFDGLTCQEIAQHLEISKSAVENQIGLALAYLREQAKLSKSLL
ncbi:RNA polymerase sigma factor [Pedobacter caeni]|uniref:RNA polymerase sigma-70 factor, ECF subfamily n=1 Tax=Pedobacter caeni TaxID=288992 RepID=A0A1M4Z2Y9_9SPHI|nr:RNA polymerase sigma-70 factor [Pedobacter caeni]SHF12434.1 RNA polymerase sigma-70 factor, ECF subfamily [Pedobacter caeni]